MRPRERRQSRFRGSEPAYRQRAIFETSLECVALEVLHYQEVHAVMGADVVKVANMRMVERGDGASFALEALTRAGLKDLDRRWCG